ncbi:cellulose binding domain-containing protein [Jonesia quinghaiensis]|uniref:cellulose binding domain-containing protein n=1 Tax=Jonesia quinghaiensis TaxID=262806 RepID=UPI000407108A|nr:cellulose binding domain-containing protein [Jonesia quinghaiensis]
MRLRTVVATALTALLATTAGGIAATSTPMQVTAPPSFSSSPSGYSWSNVEIVGGGFVPGIVFNQKDPGLVYARTDIGGAYRLNDSTGRWIPLTDHIGWDDWSHSGILSLATDPVDTNRVYLAAGTYSMDWDPQNGAILRSADKGETWEKTMLPFRVGGNMPGRGMGERLAVDPNNNKVLYFGAESGNGLWKSTDYGKTWGKVTSFPNAGNYVADASGAYTGQNQGVVWVTFDPTSAKAGQTTQTIYVGVADKQNNVYRSTDGGATWQRVPGQPTGFLAQKGVLDHKGQQLYIATSDTGGPYDGSKGDVWRLDISSGQWTRISPIPSTSSNSAFGYSGLAIDRKNPDTIMVVSQVSWWPDMYVYRSTDRGKTWSPIWELNGSQPRTKRYNHDYSGAPWLDFGNTAKEPEANPKLGWMTQSFEIDPHNSDRFFYGTGAGIYGGTNLTNWDKGKKVDITVKAQGIEETAAQDLAAPPGNVDLYSALADIGGFTHKDISQVPNKYYYKNPHHDTVTSIDFAESKPATVVRAGKSISGETTSWVGVSTDAGETWKPGATPSGVKGPGSITVSANGSSIVWAPEGATPRRSTNSGSSWSTVSGLPQNAQVASDRVNANTLYGFADGKFYHSTNGGASFTASAFTGFPTSGNVRFRAVPGRQGHLWLAGGVSGSTYGMWRSTDGGKNWTKVSGVQEGDAVGFGKATSSSGYPVIFTSAKIGGVRGIFRSDDEGKTWKRINDDQNQWYWTGASITGDPDVEGRVYIGTNGRGIIVGDSSTTPTSGQDSGSASGNTGATPAPETPDSDDNTGGSTDTGEPSEPGTGSGSGTAPDVGNTSPGNTSSCMVRYSTTDWGSGFTGAVTITNTSPSPINGWTLAFTYPSGQTISSVWSATQTLSGSNVVLKNSGWNATIPAGGSVEFGFNGAYTSKNTPPTSFSLNGVTCALAD